MLSRSLESGVKADEWGCGYDWMNEGLGCYRLNV